MLKYLALLKVDKPDEWGKWHSLPTAKYYKSSIEEEKKTVEKWIKKELKKYPNSRVNESKTDREFFINTGILAFDDEESEDINKFLEYFFRSS